ncbi:radical SAM protein [Thermodesulfovibrio sp. Kuro-1]|uniref:radical SAM protein n=1 Tax=Thermodesulfovibrio sp. Kuro-1 TaxID=2580394 RepID=UPI001144033A|nr:radical SAM protein [Thermodesulfovibrio sp. Kuro-1]
MRKIFEKINALLEKEKGTIFKEHGGRIRICLIYPNLYPIGISNLGFQTVYRLFNQRKDIVCERVFLPKDIEDYKKYPLVSFESKTPIYAFDILAFSLCFENDYPSILKILELGKVPYYSFQRNFNHPLVIAGGVLCFTNPEPVAQIFDIIFIGEAEGLIDKFIEVYKFVKNNSYEEDFKENLKREVLKLDGFYVPEAYEEIHDAHGKLIGRQSIWNNASEKIKRVYCKEFTKKFSFSQIITQEAVFSNMFLVETMRGCPFSCRFCLVGHVYKPVRKANIEDLKSKIEELKPFQAGLIAPSITAYKELKELLKISDVELSFTSLRADKSTIEILKTLALRKTVTLAPEAGTDRLRRIIKKEISENDLLLIAQELNETELEILKLYFMIGLPFEKDEEIDEIVNLIKKIRSVFQRKITASVSIFVPKPFTPFQWHRMEKYEIVKEKLKKLKKDTLQIKGFKLVHEVPKYSYMEGYFAKAPRKAISVIERLSKGENFWHFFDEIQDSLYEIKSFNDYLPWDFIEHEGLSKEALWKEYEKAIAIACQTDNI